MSNRRQPVSYPAILLVLFFFPIFAQCPAGELSPVAVEPSVPVKRVQIRAESRRFLSVAPIQTRHPGEPVRAPGRVAFRQQAVSSVGTAVAGRIASIRVQAGDRVAAGAVLMVLQSPEAAAARATLASARAALQLAEETAKRQALMLTRGVGIELEKLAADRALREAQAEFDRAQRTAQLLGGEAGEQVLVKAPIAGTVLRVNTSVGAAVAPGGEPLVELGNAGSLWIVADVFEQDLGLLAAGDKVDVELAAAPVYGLHGTVTALGGAVADEQRRAPVYVTLTDAAENLRAGMYARVAIHPRQAAHMLLPATAVLIKDGTHTVVYVETAEGIYEPREVTVGPAVAGQVPILDGLHPGERVVIRGALLLDGEAEQLL